MEFKTKIKEKRWDPKLEPIIFKKWQGEKLYKFDKKSKKPVFSIDTPPPYVNTPIHIGHAYESTWMDIIARFRRMIGFNVLFPIGLDKNGLPIEIQTEKAFKISMHETPREEFIKKCKQLIEKAGDISLDSFKKLGISFNSWEKAYEVGGKYDTDDPEYRRLTQETFIELWKKGLVYQDTRPNNYCPSCKTTLADAEVAYQELSTELVSIKFRVKEVDQDLIIATTRPELLCSCRMILVHPEDNRYLHLHGKHVIVPIYEREVKIIPHQFAKPEFGSGAVMVCSYGDYSDVMLFRELGLKEIISIDIDGRMTKNSGEYAGLIVQDARKSVIEDLREMDLLAKDSKGREIRETILHRTPVCERSGTPIEIIPMPEFYLKQVDFKQDILKIVDQISFFAPESKQILLNWINSISIDWVLSRRRYYGTEIPLWYCKNCGFIYVPTSGKYYQPWKEDPPIKKCPKCGGEEFRGEERTFDTWFDSSTSEVYILGYLWNKEFFKKHFPCSIRPQGKEIVRNWLYYTLLKAHHLFEKRAFDNVWIHMHVVDDEGKKMSKSKGNIIDPQEVLKRYGTEAFRIWTCLEGDFTVGDIKCSFERIEGTSKFLTKLWNISRFISAFPRPNDVNLTSTDRWILGELSELVEGVKKDYMNYRFSAVANSIRDFVWNLFAPHYVEMAKPRAYGVRCAKVDQKSAWFTLHACLQTILKLMAPITPFITDYIWREVYSKKSIHKDKFPELGWKTTLNALTPKLVDFNSKVWGIKKEKGVSLKDSMEIAVPGELKPFKKDLIAMHNIK